MADQDHLARVREGPETWNAWRGAYPEVVPNLMASELSGIDLSSADLRAVDLRGSFFFDAVLTQVRFDEATLGGVNFKNADLRNASFRNSVLRGASFIGAKLAGADFDGADFDGAFVCGVDLSEARNITFEQIQTAFSDAQTQLPHTLRGR